MSEIVELAPTIGDLVHELQVERGLSSGLIGSKGATDFRRKVSAQRRKVDQALQVYQNQLSMTTSLALYPRVAAALDAAKGELSRIVRWRNNVDQLSFSVNDVMARYSAPIHSLIQAISVASLASDDQHISRDLLAYSAILQAKEASGVERGLGAGLIARKSIDPQSFAKLAELQGAQAGFITQFLELSTPEEIRIFEGAVTPEMVEAVERYRIAMADSLGSTSGMDLVASEWFGAATARINALKSVEDYVKHEVTVDIETLLDEQSTSLFASMAAYAVVALLLAGFLLVAILKPIRAMVSNLRVKLDIDLVDGEMEESAISRRLDEYVASSEEAARIKAALDQSSINAMLADADNKIIYMNQAVRNLLRSIQDDIRQQFPDFDVDHLIGRCIDDFHVNPEHQRNMLATLRNSHEAKISVGPRRMAFTASPIMANGKRAGTLVEWLDQTNTMKMQDQIRDLLRGAGQGYFDQKVDPSLVDGTMREICEALNTLVATFATTLGELANRQDAMADGDLTYRIENTFEGKFAEMVEQANDTSDRLSEMVREVVTSATDITTAISEIQSGTNHLAERTQQAASNLQETAASMEEMSSSVAANADSSNRANDLASSASRAATDSGEVVDQAVSAMARIEESAKKIGEIVGVIDGIAFQTNLLALNASVEAARAGEAGKGFAVVASEVRTLAQRSSQAASDIRNLIGESDVQVQEGVGLVNKAGEQLKQIVTSIAEVATLIREIANASQEQSSGVHEITSAVSEMDSMTQQNASMVDEHAAAARILATQAERLGDVIRFFKVDSGSSGSAALPAREHRAEAHSAPLALPARNGANGHGGNGHAANGHARGAAAHQHQFDEDLMEF